MISSEPGPKGMEKARKQLSALIQEKQEWRNCCQNSSRRNKRKIKQLSNPRKERDHGARNPKENSAAVDGNRRGTIEEPARGEIPCPRPTCGSGEEDDDPKDSREIRVSQSAGIMQCTAWLGEVRGSMEILHGVLPGVF